MKKKLLLIGGGVISTHYKAGLASSPLYELVALSDINPQCASREIFSTPFFTEYVEALKTGVDVAMISTSTNSHYAIAKDLLQRGISVICEKPLCQSYDEVVELYTLAKAKKIDMGCLFHWKYADEVLFLKSKKSQLGRIQRINVRICDDYANTEKGHIRSDRRGLAGAWLDSGINVLSYVDELCDLTDYALLNEERELDESTGQVKYVRRVYRFAQTTVDITVDWRTASRDKTAEIVCDLGSLQVNHTLQTVLLNGKALYENPIEDRLSGHYVNAFARYAPSNLETERALLLHKILFDGGAK